VPSGRNGAGAWPGLAGEPAALQQPPMRLIGQVPEIAPGAASPINSLFGQITSGDAEQRRITMGLKLMW